MGAMLSCHTVLRVSLEIGSVGPSALLFQIVFVLLGFFCSHVDNRISSLASTFFFCCAFDFDYIKCTDQVQKIGILKNLSV